MAVVIGSHRGRLRKDLKARPIGVEAANVALPVDGVAGFEVVELIGSGGFSHVYRARQLGFDRDVALKVLEVGLDTDAERAAFERECRAIGALSAHPNIVTVFGAAVAADGRPCLVMELCGDGTMADRVSSAGPLAVAEVLTIGVELAGALQTAHDSGIVHRDVKPHNVFRSDFGASALGDFGISSFDGDRTVTGGGRLTVHYSAPETIEGEPATAASDLYSLAATLYTLAAGDKPFPRAEGQSVGDLARRILREPAPLLAGEAIPVELAELIRAAMAKRPSERPGSVAEFGAGLQQIQAARGWPVTPMVTGDGATTAAKAVSAEVAGSPWQTPGNRRLTSAGLGGLAIVALVSTAIALQGARDAPATADRPVPPVIDADDAFFAAPSRPDGVTVTATVDGRVRVSWRPVDTDAVVGHEIDRLGTDDPPMRTDADELVFERGPEPVCVVVRAVGDGGRLSADSDPVCLAG